jgi:putative ABC transport system permease protein
VVRTLRVKRRRDLTRQKAQFGAVIVTLFLGVALYGATSDAYRNLDASYKQLYDELRFADLTVTGGPVQELARQARAGGALAAVRTVVDVPFRVGDAELVGRLVGMPAQRQPDVDRLYMLSGTYLDPGEPRGVVVEQHMASHFDLAIGDVMLAGGVSGWEEVHAVGVAASAEYLWPARSRQSLIEPLGDFGVLFAPEPLVRRLATPSTPLQVVIAQASPTLIETLAGEARSAGALEVLTQAEQPSNAALQEDVQGFGEMALLFPLLFLTAAAMATYVLLGRLVRAERAEIGMLSANGVPRRDIFRNYIGYGLIAGAAGGLAGAIVGMFLGRWITGAYTAAISVPITVTSLSVVTPLVGLVIALAAGAVSAIAPARAAMRMTPVEAMRGPMAAGTGRLSLLERLLPPLRRASGSWRLVLRDIGRSRRRTVSTMVGVVLSLMLVLVSWGMLDTTDILLSRQFDTIERQDAQLYPGTRVSASMLSDVSRVRGVAAVEHAAELPVSLSRAGRSYGTTLIGMEPDTVMHGFLLTTGETGTLRGGGILAGAALETQLSVAVGDTVEVRSPSLPNPITLRVDGFLDEPLGTLAYVSLPALRAAAGQTDALENTMFVRYTEGADPTQVQTDLRQVPGVAVVVDAKALARSVGGLMGLFYAFVGVMLVFGAVMSFALMFNTMSANVAERATEMATLRAAGVGRRTLSGILSRENLVVTAMGIVPGLALGTWLAAVFMDSFSSDLFSFSLQIRWSTLVLSALAMLGVALLSQWPGVRAVGRLDIASVVRERSL